jgi:hypothetical protein
VTILPIIKITAKTVVQHWHVHPVGKEMGWPSKVVILFRRGVVFNVWDFL